MVYANVKFDFRKKKKKKITRTITLFTNKDG